MVIEEHNFALRTHRGKSKKTTFNLAKHKAT